MLKKFSLLFFFFKFTLCKEITTIFTGLKTTAPDHSDQQDQYSLSYTSSVYQSCVMIFFNEIADKTFICVVIFSAKNSKIVTFLLSMIALSIMNVMAVTVGVYIPLLVYRWLIDWIAILAFTIFGCLYIYDGYKMENESLANEIEEVENDLEKDEKYKEPLITKQDSQLSSKHIDSGKIINDKEHYIKPACNNHSSNKNIVSVGYFAFISQMIIAECGDKTQIETIVIATVFNPLGVFVGATIGFALCVILAILCGKLFGKYVSEKMFSFIGGGIFLLFSIQLLMIKLQII